MKAVQITGLEEMAVVELEKPEIKSNEVLLKMNYVGFSGKEPDGEDARCAWP